MARLTLTRHAVTHVKALAITVRALTAWMPQGCGCARGAVGSGDGRDDQRGDPVAASGHCWA